MNADVVVVGSVNLDLVLRVPAIPRPGQTMLASSRRMGHGGKGGNQAVAAAQMGSVVSLVGRVGQDESGDKALQALRSEGVDVRAISRGTSPTGLACVLVGPDGDNSIIVSAGANAEVGAADVDAHRELVQAAAVTLCQLEVSVAAVERAALVCSGIFVLNPAPAMPLSAALLDSVDVLVPNAGELATMVGDARQPKSVEDAIELARKLPCPVVVVTLGANGAVVVDRERIEHLPPQPVDPVDTTGAGDVFCGVFAAGLATGRPLIEAAARAVEHATASTLSPGARWRAPDLPNDIRH